MLDYVAVNVTTNDCTATGVEENYSDTTGRAYGFPEAYISVRNSYPTGGVDPYSEYLKYIEAIIRKEEWKVRWKRDFLIMKEQGKRLKKHSAYPLPAKHTRKTVRGTTPIRRNKERRI